MRALLLLCSLRGADWRQQWPSETAGSWHPVLQGCLPLLLCFWVQLGFLPALHPKFLQDCPYLAALQAHLASPSPFLLISLEGVGLWSALKDLLSWLGSWTPLGLGREARTTHQEKPEMFSSQLPHLRYRNPPSPHPQSLPFHGFWIRGPNEG